MQKVKYSSAPDQVIDYTKIIERVLSTSVKIITLYALFIIAYLFLYGLIDLKNITPSQTHNGFNTLTPYLSEFKAFRNIGYLGSISLFIIGAGFNLFLKSTSLKQSLAALIKSILLITFSYAIAGLLLDIVQVIRIISSQS